MKSFLKLIFAMLFALTLFFLMLVIFIIVISLPAKPDLKKHSYLLIEYTDQLEEYPPVTGWEEKLIGEEPETLHRILENLEKAAVDKKIDGVILRIHGDGGGYAMLTEIRAAIAKFRQSQKKVYAYATTMTRKSYFLAAACDSIFMPPSGYFAFTGFASEHTFIKGTLDKLGIQANLHKIKDYKTAAEIFQETQMTKNAREMSTWLLDEMWDLFVTALENDRGLTRPQIETAMRQALFPVTEAVQLKLIDDSRYWDELEAQLKQPSDKNLRLISQKTYAEIDSDLLDFGSDQKIAVVHAQGLIGGRQSSANPMLGITMGYESVINDLKAAAADEDVQAIILRVNSGGGDALTSDLISHYVDVLSKKKPVIVSMVDVAASGGYLISYRANKLVANTISITGSIGSISGKFNLKKFYDKLGISKDFVTRGPMALLFSDYRDFTSEEWARFTENHWVGFNTWLQDVAARRGMSVAAVEKLAHGRVWTGRQAKANGLIDEVGGLDVAVEIARQETDIPAEEKISLVHYPVSKSLPEMLFELENLDLKLVNSLLYRWFQLELPRVYQEFSRSQWLVWDGLKVK
ncbi:signal peptide peptidase SppA [candidate division KSB1 bacterium]|nr:signal peptide peptidase SppA [candidate division KSB1 bacterium]